MNLIFQQISDLKIFSECFHGPLKMFLQPHVTHSLLNAQPCSKTPTLKVGLQNLHTCTL